MKGKDLYNKCGVMSTTIIRLPCQLHSMEQEKTGKTGHWPTDNNGPPAVSDLQTRDVPCLNCKRPRLYGPRGGAAERCVNHRRASDIRLNYVIRRDDCDVCGATASYGEPGGFRRKCVLHKTDVMVNLTSKRLPHDKKSPRYSLLVMEERKLAELALLTEDAKRKLAAIEAEIETASQYVRDLCREGVEPNPGPPKIAPQTQGSTLIACKFHKQRGVTGADCADCMRRVTAEMKRASGRSQPRNQSRNALIAAALHEEEERRQGEMEALAELNLADDSSQSSEASSQRERDHPPLDLAARQKEAELRLNLPSTNEKFGHWSFSHRFSIPVANTALGASAVFAAASLALKIVARKRVITLVEHALARFNVNLSSRFRLAAGFFRAALFCTAAMSLATAALMFWRLLKSNILTLVKHKFSIEPVDADNGVSDDGWLLDRRPENVRKLPVKYSSDLAWCTYKREFKLGPIALFSREYKPKLVSTALFKHAQSMYNDDVSLQLDILKERNTKTVNVMPVDVPVDAQMSNQSIYSNTLWLRMNWLRSVGEKFEGVPFPGVSNRTGIT